MLGATSSINNYPNIFGIQTGNSMESLAQSLNSATNRVKPTSAATADSVTISSLANKLQQFLNTEMQGNEETGEGEVDLMGLAQLKQRGEMLAGMLQMKMKNFESNLMTHIQGAGLPMQNMNIKGGDEGLLLEGDMTNQETLQSVLGGLKNEFSEIAQFAEMLSMLQQTGNNQATGTLSGLVSSASHYAQQSLSDKTVKRSDSDFVMHVTPSGTSFSFE